MIVAVDDSGDPGMKLYEGGSSRFFVIAAICFEKEEEASKANAKIEKLRKKLGWRPEHEFKFRKTSLEIKKNFFRELKNLEMRCVVVVVDKIGLKCKIKNPSSLYNVAILRAISMLGLNGAYLYIDGEGGNNYRKRAKSYFRQNLSKGAIRQLTYCDSRANNLIQVADMIAGAARREAEFGDKDKLLKGLREIRIVKDL